MLPTIIVSQDDWISLGCPTLNEFNSFQVASLDYHGQTILSILLSGGTDVVNCLRPDLRIFVKTKAQRIQALGVQQTRNGG